jgi:hypothetical protein
MPRTSSLAVEAIIDVVSGDDVMPFIEVANDVVTNVCGTAGYTATTLELIERWLAAHFYAIRFPRATSQSMGASESYSNVLGKALDQTTYGQQAKAIDYKGTLARAGMARATMFWLGKTIE